MVYCPAYRRVFSMLDDGAEGQEEGLACSRGSDRSRQRSFPYSCWRPAARRRRPRPSAAVPSAPAASVGAAASAPASVGVRVAAALAGHEVQGRQRQHPDVQRPAGRGAAPASGAGLGAADRRPRQRRRRRLPDDLRQGAARRVDGHELVRRLRLRSAVDGRLRRPGLPARPDRSREERPPARPAGHRPVLPRLQLGLQRQGLHDPARRRLPHGLLPERPAHEGRPQAAGDLGRLPRDRPEVQRPGPQRRRPARLRLVHRQEEGRPELLVDHLRRRRPAPEQGHGRRRVLRHLEHEPALRPERGDDPRPPDLRQDGPVRPARRAEHGRRRRRAACSRPAAAP